MIEFGQLQEWGEVAKYFELFFSQLVKYEAPDYVQNVEPIAF